MHGVTTALVLFLLTCVVFPHLVKNRVQYYAAFVALCLIILLDALGMMISGPGVDGSTAAFRVFAYVAIAFLQVCGIILLFLACGGITWRALASDMKQAFEVIRRGEDTKEVVIPLSGEMARRASSSGGAQKQADPDAPRERIVLDDQQFYPSPIHAAPADSSTPHPAAPPPGTPASPAPPPPARQDQGTIPLEQ